MIALGGGLLVAMAAVLALTLMVRAELAPLHVGAVRQRVAERREARLMPRMKTFGYHRFAQIDRRVAPPARGLFRGARGLNRPIQTNDDWWSYWNEQLVGVGRRLGLVDPSLTGASPQLTLKHVRNYSKAAITTADTGAINPLYSFLSSSHVTSDRQILTALPQQGWTIQGWRGKTTAGKTSAIGIGENAALGTGVESVWAEVNPSPKEIEAVYDMSVRFRVLQQLSDGIPWELVQDEAMSEFLEAWDTDLLKDAATATGNNVTSLDKLFADASREDVAGYVDGDADVYNLVRDTDTWSAANLNDNAGTDRNFTTFLVDEMMSEAEPYWEDGADSPEVWFGLGRDTFERWSSYEATKEIVTMQDATLTLGDGLRYSGTKGGYRLLGWRNRAMVRDGNVEKDTISRVYGVHNKYVWTAIGLPLVTIVAGEDPEDMVSVGHTMKNVLYGIVETYAVKFPALSELADLK